MKLVACLFIGSSLVALSQPTYCSPIQDQINNLGNVQNQLQAQELARQQEIEYQRQLREREAIERAEKSRRDDIARQTKAREQAIARESARQASMQKDKDRDQAYEDQLRALEVEKLKKRVNREDDYIDVELTAKRAEADRIKADADAQRNVSEGIKTKLSGEGNAAVNVSEGVKSKLSGEGAAAVADSEGNKNKLTSEGKATETANKKGVFGW